MMFATHGLCRTAFTLAPNATFDADAIGSAYRISPGGYAIGIGRYEKDLKAMRPPRLRKRVPKRRTGYGTFYAPMLR